jgi:hypothetical protein
MLRVDGHVADRVDGQAGRPDDARLAAQPHGVGSQCGAPSRRVPADVRLCEVVLSRREDLLGPLGLKEEERYPTYRGTEEVVYLSSETNGWAFVPPTVAAIATTASGWSTWRSRSTPGKRWTRRMSGVRGGAIGSTTRRSRTATSRTTTHSSSSIRMDSASRSSLPGRIGPRASTGTGRPRARRSSRHRPPADSAQACTADTASRPRKREPHQSRSWRDHRAGLFQALTR